MTSQADMAPVDARSREARTTVPVYEQFPFVPVSADGCEITTSDGQRLLDFYGGHAVAALGYSHPRLTEAIQLQAQSLLFQSNAAALDVRAEAAEKLVSIAPPGLERVFFVNSGAEANENALRMACVSTGRTRVLAIEHGFHGRTAAAAAVTWKSAGRWYGFPALPFDVDFIPRNDVESARSMIDDTVAAVIFEPVQGVAGAFALDAEFVRTLRKQTRSHGAILIADEVQSGLGRSGQFFSVQNSGVTPDVMTCAKALGGGVPCGAVLVSETLSSTLGVGQLGTTFGGGPLAAAAMVAVIDTIVDCDLLQNVRARETEIRQHCVTGPVKSVQGQGLLLGLVCDRAAKEIHAELLTRGILAGTSAAPDVLRLLPPLIITSEHVAQLSAALADIGSKQ